MSAEIPKFYMVKKERRFAVPNWCDVEYKCVGDPKEVSSLHKVLKYMDKRKTTIIENGFGKWWLGNLVERLDGDWTTFNCRGAGRQRAHDQSLYGMVRAVRTQRKH